jgi:hypothetical protein
MRNDRQAFFEIANGNGKQRFEDAFSMWMNDNPLASASAIQNMRMELWRKWLDSEDRAKSL